MSQLAKQNPGLNTKFWRAFPVKSKSKVEAGTPLVINMDEDSMPTMDRLGGRPYFGLGRVLFVTKRTQPR